MSYALGAGLASVALIGAALFLWGRGMIKARRDDLVAGFVVFVIACLICTVADGSSAALHQVGALMVLFGLVTLGLSSFAKRECPLTRGQRLRFGIGAIILGLFLQFII
jgi:hypothetical protein